MKRIIYISIVLCMFFYGFSAGKYQLFPYDFFQNIARLDFVKHLLKQKPKALLIEGYADTSNKTEVNCEIIDRKKTMVILALGQANAANSAEVEYSAKHNVFNIFNGKCYKAADPLLGASATTNERGSVWGRLADYIIESNMYDTVVIKSIAVAGSPMASWTVNGTGIGWGGILQGNYHSRIIEANQELNSLGFSITHILWHQGEADTINGTTTEEYKKQFLNMRKNIRQNNIIAPIYVALASRYYNKRSLAVIRAQKQLSQEHDDILRGPNTDLIDKLEDRTALGCHFSEVGVEKHAKAWLHALRKQHSKN